MGQVYWVASYPKSGNTWVRAFLTTLVLGDLEPNYLDKVGLVAPNDNGGLYFQRFLRVPINLASFQELATARPLAHRAIAADSKGFVFLKTHSMVVRHFGTPTITPDITAGAIYIIRNPLDVVVSYSEFRRRTIDETIQLLNESRRVLPRPVFASYQVSGSWSENVDSWTRRENKDLMVLRYEDMLLDPKKAFQRLVSFIGIQVREDEISRAIERTSFGALKAIELRNGFKERPSSTETFFRAGSSGQWRERLSRKQIAQVIRPNAAQMQRFGYWEPDFDRIDLDTERRNGATDGIGDDIG
jgi:hypothetical protein